MTKPEFQLLKCSCVPTAACSFCSSVLSAPSPLACMVAHTSSSTLMMPGGRKFEIFPPSGSPPLLN
ncbi:hypothetical protein EYF80_049442 [Liparis tanakae]|uniref:Uncharacterized protein n=1 Tax=Liparis tanakae TaxID=230148 RepID=A0A4Z2FGQ3_9TELE|nr:hypothetical protein EYF80_049442 [Liparis tanakae]